ncbi:hypothetical protein L2E82_07885 [Cichorium intybus]|uniref:Uncharacterized protein n=1 Tax=Cichorium intybus TaxID=13427 RepID=A0ACB9G509_CICIN|nr:hypothetical protein L2E82_07885 [Cichorium intybus]
MKAAAGVANQLGKPWVLDPTAVEASSFRLKACLELIELKPTVIRGNGSEIIALSMASIGSTKGADSLHESSDAVESAKSLAKSSGSIVAISGSVDFVTDVQRVVGAHNGVPLMQKITVSGCAATALIATFVAIDPEIAKSTRFSPWLALNFYMGNSLNLNHSTIQLVQNFGNIPMVAKPLYGILSDAIFIGGSHRLPCISIGG